MRSAIKVMAIIAMVISVATKGYATEPQDEPIKQVYLSSTNLKILEFSPEKKGYSVGEPIKLRIKLNKSAYVYIFNVDRNTGATRLIYPNKFARNNRLKGGKRYVIPGSSSWEIKTDSPGVEDFMVIASTKKQKFDIPEPSKGMIFSEISKKDFDTKILSIRRRTTRTSRTSRSSSNESVTAWTTVIVSGEGATGRAHYSSSRVRYTPNTGRVNNRTLPVVLLNVSPRREVYYVGDTITVAFGSTYDGYIYLLMVYENEDKELVGEYEVRANTIEYENFIVDEPTGKQYLIAVYSPTRITSDRGTSNNGTLLASKVLNFASGPSGETKGLTSLDRASSIDRRERESEELYQIVPLLVRR